MELIENYMQQMWYGQIGKRILNVVALFEHKRCRGKVLMELSKITNFFHNIFVIAIHLEWAEIPRSIWSNFKECGLPETREGCECLGLSKTDSIFYGVVNALLRNRFPESLYQIVNQKRKVMSQDKLI